MTIYDCVDCGGRHFGTNSCGITRKPSNTGAKINMKFVLVPEEPTEEMLIAAAGALKAYIKSLTPEQRKALNITRTGYRITPRLKAIVRYKAMLAARPRAE